MDVDYIRTSPPPSRMTRRTTSKQREYMLVRKTWDHHGTRITNTNDRDPLSLQRGDSVQHRLLSERAIEIINMDCLRRDRYKGQGPDQQSDHRKKRGKNDIELTCLQDMSRSIRKQTTTVYCKTSDDSPGNVMENVATISEHKSFHTRPKDRSKWKNRLGSPTRIRCNE